ncbi:hypothetical protein RB12797 [Rhodopirellula baltica SH 1]|uniref:Uncharacterized protein n=1 Tax=Rhodopirellula baltica (strain DSM 10527 / NCIMB 13988 / SH1) TaxID=243090 RepID=Q7UI30_RHOBA|nr:hypothetical protein RB12797 [Rhodopirellula baltica SH 1]
MFADLNWVYDSTAGQLRQQTISEHPADLGGCLLGEVFARGLRSRWRPPCYRFVDTWV